MSGVTGTLPPPPETSDREISADLSGKEARKKLKHGEKKENWKREGGKLKWKEGKSRNEERIFFLLFTFSKRQQFVLGVPKWKFSTGKTHFMLGKRLSPIEKNSVRPLQGMV